VPAGRFGKPGEKHGWSVKPVLAGLAIAGVALVVGFVLADPYALLDFARFRTDLKHLSSYTKGSLLLGETQRSGYLYYLWSIGWATASCPRRWPSPARSCWRCATAPAPSSWCPAR